MGTFWFIASMSRSRSRPIWRRKSGCSSWRSAVTDFLLATAGVILFTVAVGLLRILGGPGDADRMMAAQLIGTGGIGSLLLIAAATGARGVEDVALGLALLAAFASAAFVNSAAPAEEPIGKLRTANEFLSSIFSVSSRSAPASFSSLLERWACCASPTLSVDCTR